MQALLNFYKNDYNETVRINKEGIKVIKFVDLFAGIGGIRIGFENATQKLGFNTSCVLSSEKDDYAKKTYEINFNEIPHGDIRDIKNKQIPDFDFLFAGFPCQPFSIAGYRNGFDDDRGNLFFEIIRFIKYGKPQIVFLENVKNLLGHNNGETYKVVEKLLKKEGYFIKHAVLNTMEYGNLPQNRERIYIVCFKSKKMYEKFSFPEKIKLKRRIQEFLENKVEEKFLYNGKSLFKKLKNEVNSETTVYQWRRKYVRENKKGVCPTLTANMGTGGHNVPIIKQGTIIRKLTCRECLRLQGFPDTFIFPDNLSVSRSYKQVGNSVSISVVERIFEKILETYKD